MAREWKALQYCCAKLNGHPNQSTSWSWQQANHSDVQVSILNLGDEVPKHNILLSDGVGRTGAFICIYSQLERVKTEGVADIFQFVKASRLQRKGLIRHLVGLLSVVHVIMLLILLSYWSLQDHYIFCYEVIADFSDTMGLYSNFRNVV